MDAKTKKSKITKRELLYVLWVVALIAVMATAIILVANFTRTDNVLEGDGSSSVLPVDPDSGSNPPADTGSGDEGNEGDEPTGGGNEGDLPSGGDTPVVGKITFIMPCEGAEVLKKYTADTVVFNSTLGAYMGHLAIDYSAEEGAEVKCVYDGVVESVTTSYLTGTTVTVDHGNGLKSVYNSIEAAEGLYEGVSLEQGDVIGFVSANNLQEYKDGPHLHFEVLKNGEKINPEEYLIGEEK